MLKTCSRSNALTALLLLVSAACLGRVMALYAPGSLGQIASLLCQIWLLVLPLAWFFWVDRGKLSISLPKRRELLAGTVLGVLMFGIILGAYWLFGQHWIDVKDIRNKAQQVGINSPIIYLVGAMYWTFINSLFEEYIWRWFVYSKCEVLIPGKGAVLLCGLLFTLHHIINLVAYTDNWLVVVLASLGVFLAGAVWSWCYLMYRSIWPSYFSHILADLALAIVSWQLLFG
ncbi:MAG TPA: CPBP family intramembrane metalloprotease [Cyanobacteria bacterium UBA8553]|nr:CPBP family intramembrane metalloprotease [Cyanobacteria bacterium UBA8553]HAJ64228.1 CPBP family intramembrane metalloprotease [Cyanobacteria bacterium UBA8543]